VEVLINREGYGMINQPIIILGNNFQHAWIEVAKLLICSRWELRNLIVQIKDTKDYNSDIHDKVTEFAKKVDVLTPKQVAYTIFPHGLYKRKGTKNIFFKEYNRPLGMYDRLMKKKRGWGTYFRRMTNYDKNGVPINQLGNIIDAINKRSNTMTSAYTMIIQNPGGEMLRPLGGPCLNYIAVQLDTHQKPLGVGLLAVYRNHDFIERAYGNYWGLCNLLNFIAAEVGGTAQCLTCISSHAFVPNKRMKLKYFVEKL
jgi:hypothetical protein